jgi:hypothetical protein
VAILSAQGIDYLLSGEVLPVELPFSVILFFFFPFPSRNCRYYILAAELLCLCLCLITEKVDEKRKVTVYLASKKELFNATKKLKCQILFLLSLGALVIMSW